MINLHIGRQLPARTRFDLGRPSEYQWCSTNDASDRDSSTRKYRQLGFLLRTSLPLPLPILLFLSLGCVIRLKLWADEKIVSRLIPREWLLTDSSGNELWCARPARSSNVTVLQPNTIHASPQLAYPNYNGSSKQALNSPRSSNIKNGDQNSEAQHSESCI